MGRRKRHNEGLIPEPSGFKARGGQFQHIRRHTVDTYLNIYVRTIKNIKFHSFHFPLNDDDQGNMAGRQV